MPKTVPGQFHSFLIDGQLYEHQDDPSHGHVEGASVSTTLRYRFNDRLSAGVHYDPRARHVGGVANFVALTENAKRPALVLGTSSDRIGLPHGQAYYMSVSKNLERETGWPIAPYAGVVYGTYDGRVRPMGGVNVAFRSWLSSLVMYDGVNVHPVINLTHRRNIFSLLLVRGRHPGFGYNVSF